MELAPPQVVIMGHLAELASVEALAGFCASADLAPVLPVLWARGKGPEAQRLILLPWDPDYQAGAPADPDQPCPASQASRLLNHRGCLDGVPPWPRRVGQVIARAGLAGSR